jgi:hypothetical protein
MILIHDTAARSCCDTLSTKGQGVPRTASPTRPEPVEKGERQWRTLKEEPYWGIGEEY